MKPDAIRASMGGSQLRGCLQGRRNCGQGVGRQCVGGDVGVRELTERCRLCCEEPMLVRALVKGPQLLEACVVEDIMQQASSCNCVLLDAESEGTVPWPR